jgi:hypothetical protein
MRDDDLLEPDDQEPSEEDVERPDDADEGEDGIALQEHVGLTPPD